MSEHDAFDRVLAAVHDATLDESRWPATSALIDEACGLTGNGLMVAEGPTNDVRALFVGLYYRGQRRDDLEREYLTTYHPLDERVPRFRQLPARRLVHITDLYTAEELKTSRTYNELLPRAGMQDGLNVQLHGLAGSHIGWGLNDPVDAEGWGSSRITRIERLLPHIQQFVRVRQVLAGAGALGASLADLLATTGLGIIQVDGRGRIAAANDRALALLRTGDGLVDKGGVLGADVPADDAVLQGLLTRALPPFGGQGAGGSMTVRRAADPHLALLARKIGALDQAAPLAGGTLPEAFGRLRRLVEARLGQAGTREYVQVLRRLEDFRLAHVSGAIQAALRLGAIGFDAVKHLVRCRLEHRPPRLDLAQYPHLPAPRVTTTAAADDLARLGAGAE